MIESSNPLTQKGFNTINSDVSALIKLFRHVLTDLGLSETAEHLPWEHSNFEADQPHLSGQDGHSFESIPHLSHAFSVAFQLLNLVEENVAEQTRRERERNHLREERDLWADTLDDLKKQGFTEDDILQLLPQIKVEPVLTAHPTEAKRLTVLEQHREIYRALVERTDHRLTHAELQTLERRIRAMLERLWRTGEILRSKPEVADERRNVQHYLREIFPDALARLDSRLRAAWVESGFHVENLSGHYPQLRFGTWVGGDRDGHAGVTAEVTQETLTELRLGALVVLDRQLTRLAEKMSLSDHDQDVPPPFREHIARMAAAVGPRATPILATNTEEPWRQFARLMAAKLPLDMRDDQPVLLEAPSFYRFPDELKIDLDILKDALEAVGAKRLVHSDLLPLYRTLETFGFHMAALDVRQNSAFHDKALAQLMMAAGLDGEDFPNWTEKERLDFLKKELMSPRPFLHPGAIIQDEAGAVLDCYRVLAAHLDRYGADGIGALIVSMTRSVSDLLVVFVLAREAGLTRMTDKGLVCALPVVPLFETVGDLEGSAVILSEFLQEEVPWASLQKAARGGTPTQQVMVGYSDSNKDMGIFASQWALQKGQKEMADVGRKMGVKIRFFHGRGGTISRGAGPTHRFLEALPHGSLSGDIRLTEQGETIAQKFGNRATATYNLELLMAGVTANTLRHRKPVLGPHPLEPIAERLAQTSGNAYRALLETEGFIPFFRQATPIDALENAHIGSRPARRTGQATLADLRAIPWVFSWNQSRFYLPGWFGLGTGLMDLKTQTPADFEALKKAASNWKFLRYVLTNVETNLASTDFNLMQAYADLVEDEAIRSRIFGIIREERQRTQEALNDIFGGTTEDRRPRMLKTLEMRAEALHILHLQQLELLKKWRASNHNEAFLPDLLLSINAIASGLRTTG